MKIKRFENERQFPSFELLVSDLRRGYRVGRRDEKEGVDYEFLVRRLRDGRSGLVQVIREDNNSLHTTALLIEDNRVAAWVDNDHLI